MKILILGAKGMLGRDLAKVFQGYRPVRWDIQDLDITKKNELRRKIKKINPRVIINAAAYTDVDGAETHRRLANLINARAVGWLAEISLKQKILLIHFSTDYVFAGKKRNGYGEKDAPQQSLNAYGRSKLLGEREIIKRARKGLKYYLIRTSWLFGPASHRHYHKNFVDTILRLAKIKKTIKVVDDQWGSPTYSYDLAQVVKNMIEKDAPSGFYHLTNSGATSWYKFAKSIVNLSKNKLKITPCSTKEYPLIAKRPKYSILLNTRLPRLRSWLKALQDYLKN